MEQVLPKWSRRNALFPSPHFAPTSKLLFTHQDPSGLPPLQEVSLDSSSDRGSPCFPPSQPWTLPPVTASPAVSPLRAGIMSEPPVYQDPAQGLAQGRQQETAAELPTPSAHEEAGACKRTQKGLLWRKATPRACQESSGFFEIPRESHGAAGESHQLPGSCLLSWSHDAHESLIYSFIFQHWQYSNIGMLFAW